MTVATDIGSLIDRAPGIRHGMPRIAGTGLTVMRTAWNVRLPEVPEMKEGSVKTRTRMLEKLKSEVISKSNNRCCVCQTPFIQFHHIDENPSNNDIDNIAPLCPNCHSQAHSRTAMTVNLTRTRLKSVRDRWYAYCEDRKDASTISASGLLRLKNLVNVLGLCGS